MRLISKVILVILLAVGSVVPVAATEIESVELQLRSFKKPQKFLNLVKALGISKKATWEEVEPLVIGVSSDLGIRSISMKSGSKAFSEIVLNGQEPPNDDPNIVITAVTIRSKKGLETYSFESGNGYVPQHSDRNPSDESDQSNTKRPSSPQSPSGQRPVKPVSPPK